MFRNIDMHGKSWIRKCLPLLLFLAAHLINAQLSDLHYLPPLKQGQNNAGIRQQAVYLSTPEPVTFTVNVYRGTNPTPVTSFNISNVSPAVYTLPNGDNNVTLVNNANTGIVLNNSGLRFESPSGNRFYVNYRGYSQSQAASLTSKGRVALGTRFKWGGVPNLGAHSSKSNTLGIMATEDNTTITLSGYDPGCEFRVGNNRAGITDDTYTVTLDANESFVFETYIGTSPTPAHEDGWIGASVVSDKDIVISNGSINFGRQANASNRDAGIDQPVPENRLGKEYVFVRGNGGTNGATEFPLIIATADNTQIFVNGAATPIATIDNGEYFEIPSSFYSSNTVGANMFVQTSKDVYAYQCMAGDSKVYTQGLNFVAPVNCLLPDVMDNIPDIRNMAGTLVNGGLTIIAAVNTPDANIQVNDGNGPVTLPPSNPVAGSPDWKTFFIPNLNGDVSVQSTGPMAVGFFGYNGARGVAGYFSGFDTVPEVTLEITGGSGCFVGSTIFEATGNFDAYQWYGDGQLIPGENGPSYAPTVAGDYFVRGTKGPCTYDSQSITALYCDPDVIVEKTVDKDEILEGETATFTIKVRNLGVGPVTNLQITDNIPAGLSLLNTFTITGSWSGNTWNIGTLNGGATAFLELEVQADPITTLPLLHLANTAINTQDQIDANITQDTPTALLTVHNDFDSDGVIDVVDLDDDNDGVYDAEECVSLANNLAAAATASSSSAASGGAASNAVDANTNGNFSNGSVAETDAVSPNEWITVDLGSSQYLDELVLWNRTDCCSDRLSNAYVMVSNNPFPTNTNLFDALANATYAYQLGNTTGQTENRIFVGTQARYIRIQKSGNNLNGNALSLAEIEAIQYTACDPDADGLPNLLDLDSDGDGCSDANEFYKDNNADGGDGGQYGSGVPVVNPTDGTVTAASYTAVFAPEIFLGNTTEDLGGNDINGQGVNLGQTIQYVLRFQNTGDDNAVNYSIRDIIPNNVTLDNVDTSNATGTTYTFDAGTRTLQFQVPDNLVEVGDPEYSIRITVTISGNCSDFVDACSSQLENLAYSTFEGVLNPTVFTDESGPSSNFPCTWVPQVGSNTILDDLANCGQARTVQLCGDDVVLAAGTGFNSYTWAIDDNGNGQLDAGDTLLDDGDPDGDPSTLLVTTIGSYIVEKSSGGSCPDLVELITVERFGTTQTNPIIDFFNQVNSDTNPDNDLQGEIVACSIDGDLMPKIFLCGENENAAIQLGITDAQSIVWQQLVEGSCADVGDDCGNKNTGCTWNDLATQDNFTITDSGKYRVVINYQNGCLSRFYFDVYKNTLDIQHSASDILCSTAGNISITNIGGNYGFQLVNAANGNILVPFSDANGPSFDIANSGTYKVQVTQLNPITGDPIPGSCIFETEDIGILDRDFQVNLSSTPADCNQLGGITVQALNVLPNYSYELRLDDGSNGGLGTLVDSRYATVDNTHNFTNVNPGDYLLVTSTDDGCSDTQQISVNEIPELTLVALTAENITCTAGIVNLTPSGGSPNPDYRMAIWSKDGVDLYTDPSAIPASELQTNSNFLFGYRGTPTTYFPNEEGDYEFIVLDDSGCFAISNSVRVDELGGLSVSASHSGIVCADSATASLTVSVSGGTAPYQYSLDGGANYQTSNTFVNLAAGWYTITVMDSSGNGGSGCIETLEYEIDQPFRLTASAAIVEDASCNPSGALVRILNANGGQAPYSYSFDGGSTFTANNEQNLLPGSYQLIVRDVLGCTYNMELTVPAAVADPNFTTDVVYACDGMGTVSLTPSNTTDFVYNYSLNGTPNTPVDSSVFTNVTDGTYTVTVGYSSALAPNQSTLFFEDFGAGPTTQIGEIGPGYCYEPQDGTATACNLGPAGILVNGEYTVTNFVTNPIPSWLSPNDHSGLVDGRFLAIDVSTLAGDFGVLWARRGLEVLPNQDITLSFWAYNLLRTTGNGNNPDVLVELVDSSGTVLASATSGDVPKNNNADDWHNFSFNLNPGANTVVDIVLRTNLNSDFGNDLILDDIQAVQFPEICEQTQDITVVVDADQAFEAQLLSVTPPSCNAGADGSIRFEVANFDVAAGFEYSLDGGASWTPSLSSPVTTASSLSDGNYNVLVRKADEPSCSLNFSAIITAPDPLVPALNLTGDYSCFNTGATLEATATGGNPAYTYQLENDLGAIVVAFQSQPVFANVTDGDYYVRVRDNNGCEALSSTVLTVVPPQAVTFTASATACYDGSNTASISASVATGNGSYTFRINGGAWLTPSPATATDYTFSGLADGNYTVEVTDGFGCISAVETVVIAPVLSALVETDDVASCNDGNITITASGGDGNYVYAFLPAGSPVTDTDFGASNMLSVTSAMVGNYDVYVRDNNGTSPHCQYMETVSIANAAVLSYTATPTDPECHDGRGAIDITIATGESPFTIELVDLDNGGASDQTVNNILANNYAFFNLLPGNYTLNITDKYGCTVTDTPVTINNPDELTATVTGVTPVSCTGNLADFGFDFVGYPGTLGTIEFSDDGGATWQAAHQFRGYISGQTVYPSLRTVDGGGNTICQTDLPEFIIPYPLDDLDITISALVVNCNELQVTVQGAEGTPNYQYTYSENPAFFDPVTPVNPWTTPATDAVTPYLFTGLIPGRTYTFYVRDAAGCVRQSNVNVNDLITQPLGISSVVAPTCNGSNTGSITYTIVENTPSPGSEMQWSFYDISSGTPVLVSNSGGNVPFAAPQTLTFNALGAGNYFVEVTKMDGALASCVSASENEILDELDAISGTPTAAQQISCDRPGLISIPDITGGGGTYSYDVAGPVSFAPISGTLDNPIEIPANSPSGAYTVTVTDQYGCSAALGSVNLNLTPNPTIDAIAVDNCGTQASVTITASSSAAQIFYSLDGGVTYLNNGGVFANVLPGTYTVSILDSNGCTDTDTVTVFPPLQANANLTQGLGCGPGNEAEIVIDVNNGSGSYEYEVLGTSGTLVTRQALTPNPSTILVSTADTYTVNVFDTNTSGPECSRTFTVDIPAATVPAFTVNSTDISCSGASDGSIAIAEQNNGINPLIFTLNPSVTAYNGTTNSFENLPPGTYEVTGTGMNGCTTTFSNIVISEPNPISFNAPSVTPFGCTAGNTADNASVSLDVASISGGSGNYVRYEFIDNSSSTVLQTGLHPLYFHTDYAGGDILVRITDDKGCSAQAVVSIPAFDALLNATVHVDDPVSCVNPGEDIRIDVTGSLSNFGSHPGNYEFRILPAAAYQPSNQFQDLPAGTYTFGIRNVNTGCEITVSHLVEEPNTFDLAVEKLADAVCYGDNGSIRLSLVDATYTGGFNWDIYDTNGTPADRSDDGPAILSGTSANTGPTAAIVVPAGDYLVEVFQAAFPECSQLRAFSITTPPASLSLDPIATTDVGCTNDQGSALIAPAGGQAPYTIDLTHIGSGATTSVSQLDSHLFQNLTAGQYDVSVTDDRGCTQLFANAFELLLPDPITGTISSTSLVCEGDTDASVSISLDPRNLITNYRFILNTYQDVSGATLLTTSTAQALGQFDNLGAGFYSITVMDDMDCTFESNIVEIADPSEVEVLLLTNTPLSCQTNATLLLVASGGTAPYSWSADGISFTALNETVTQDTHLFQNVTAGTYRYYIRDSFNCISTFSNEITLEPVAALTLSIDTAAAQVNCSGESTAVIDAVADGGLGNYQYALFTDAALTSQIRPEQSSGRFADLAAGTYYVRVQSADCTAVSAALTINEPAPLQVNPIISDITCTNADDGSIVLEVSGGSGNYQYAISPNLNQFDDENSFDGLAPGDYNVIVQDGNGCFELVEFTITEPAPLTLTTTVADEVCFESSDGSITLQVAGGTAPYTTSINSNQDGDFVQDQFTYNNLPSGTHVVFIRDANGCEINEIFEVQRGVNLTGEVRVEYQCDPLGFTSNSVEVLFEDPAVGAQVLYGLDTDDPTQMQLEPRFDNLTGGNHTLYVIHSNGCARSFDFEVTLFEPLRLQLNEGGINQIVAVAKGGSGNYTFSFNEEGTTSEPEYYIRETGTYAVTVTDENGCSITQEIFMEFIDIEIPNFFTPDGDGQNDVWQPRNMEPYPNIFIKIYDRYGRTLFTFRGNQDSWDGQYQLVDLPSGDYWYIIRLNGIEDKREFVGHFTLYRVR